MMTHRLSPEDEQFRCAFEAFEIKPEAFDHEAHVRLAYAYLCRDEGTAAAERMKRSLLAFLDHLGVDRAKYHETMTRAWIDAVAHFMDKTQPCTRFAEFIEQNPVLRNSKIMLSHYSAELLFSDEARNQYIAPDVEAIPKKRS